MNRLVILFKCSAVTVLPLYGVLQFTQAASPDTGMGAQTLPNGGPNFEIIKSDALEISDAWSPETPPGVDVAAGYFSLTNRSRSSLTLIGITTPAFRSADMHRSQLHQGMASMAQVNQLSVAGGETLRFAPGGLHLMFHGAEGQLRVGDHFPVMLHFNNGQTRTFAMAVGEGHSASASHFQHHEQHQDMHRHGH